MGCCFESNERPKEVKINKKKKVNNVKDSIDKPKNQNDIQNNFFHDFNN